MRDLKDMKTKFEKLAVGKLLTDATYQRDLDEPRAKAMAAEINRVRLGVPVVIRRNDGKVYVIDGQHRIAAMAMAGMSAEIITCEVVDEDLTRAEEACLFLALNGGRKAIRVFDKYKARLIAREPEALEFTRIVEEIGLRIGPQPGKITICAIQSIESAHRRNHNLSDTLSVLKRWAAGDSTAYDGLLIKDISNFMADHVVDPDQLASKLSRIDPAVVLRRVRSRQTSADCKRRAAADAELCLVYNVRRRKSERVLPVIATQVN